MASSNIGVVHRCLILAFVFTVPLAPIWLPNFVSILQTSIGLRIFPLRSTADTYTVVIQPGFNRATDFSDGVSVVANDRRLGVGRWQRHWSVSGVIDTSGQTVLPMRRRGWLSPPSDGLMIVSRQNTWGAIDMSGRLVVPMMPYLLFGFHDGFSVSTRFEEWLPMYVARVPTSHSGVVDTSGRLTVPHEYQRLMRCHQNPHIAAAMRDGRMGIIDMEGRVIVPFAYEWIDVGFSEGLTAARLNGMTGFLDMAGHVAIPFIFDSAWNFSDGLALVHQRGMWGFIDTQGNEAIPIVFDGAGSFSEGLAAVQVNYLWGYINTSGEMVIEPAFEHAQQFEDGFAIVNKDHSFGIIDTAGQIIVPIRYDMVMPFSYGMAFVQQLDWPGREDDRAADGFVDFVMTPQLASQIGFYNTQGELAVPMIYQTAQMFIEGHAVVWQDDLAGMINTRGEVVIPLRFERVSQMSEGLVAVQYRGRWGFVRVVE